ncbi:hypothetical protein [Kangiella koreensis]|uniref:Uncharacterized protein n=1 Tax=Kangiella koreensis (strain DSM 16069 / JCM 12317 / KCTC 12182 / SW-125) TaxID=523791 RepID=C7R827_KANKD|nr:hypothetical protein [Kangiella koreensis]ACV25809.1 hypothetical protein Kkor_0389 [Kangiella koreensis DSM 16069]
MEKSKEWLEGVKAHSEEKKRGDNPYESHTQEYLDWEEGWLDSQHDLKNSQNISRETYVKDKKSNDIAGYPASEWGVALVIGVVALLAFVLWPESKDSSKGSVTSIETVAKQSCMEYIRSIVRNKSTLDINYLTDTKVTQHSNGRYTVYMGFDAQNDFGVEQNYVAECLTDSYGSLIEASSFKN